MTRDNTPTATLSPNETVSLTIARAKDVTGRKLPAATYKTFDGASAQFTGLVGKPVVVNVWSWSCGPCIAEMPDLDKVYRALGDRMSFIGMNAVSDGEDKAREFAKKTGVTYPLWHDTDGTFQTELSIAAFPATVVANADGNIVWQTARALSADELTKKLKELFP
jgi:cytochrome c biogenesis protein CcmG, thiol:disulfide interchange protein DsbE